MPELPEVETTLRGIQPFVLNAQFADLQVRNAALRWPVPVEQIQGLLGQEIQRLYRRAKYIIFETAKGAMMLHLGMSGSVRIQKYSDIEAPKKHDHIDLLFELNNETWVLRYHDPRRFGSLLFVEQGSESHTLLDSLGPEPLADEFDAEHLFRHSRKRTVAVKNYIMNGHIVVGVGNIYASEALFLAGIRPKRSAGKVTKAEYARLSEAIKTVLAKAIEVGGTTLRDFTGSNGQAGYFRQKLNVYERDEQACRICGAEIKRIIIGQRSSFYCPNCQS